MAEPNPTQVDAFCDLHLHSTASDGTDPPETLPRLCKAAGLSAFALTDHDTTAGVAACAAAAKKIRLIFIPGIELSADPDVLHTGHRHGTLHLLGHCIDPDHPALAAVSARMIRTRAERNPRMIAQLNKLGVRITYDEVLDLARQMAGPNYVGDGADAVVGRPHIGQVLIQKGYVKTMHEAFATYLGATGAAYLRRDSLTAGQAIDAIHAAGGLVSLAHPVQLKIADDDTLEHTVARLIDLGLDGLETRHSDHTPADVQRFTRLAARFRLLATGGSDYHGARKTIALNSQRVPLAVSETLMDAATRRRSGLPA